LYLIYQSAVQLYAYQFPIEVNCIYNVCDCNRIESETFDIEQILVTINNGLIEDSVLIACSYHQIAIEYHYKFDDYLNSLKYNKKAEKMRLTINDGLLWRSKLNIGSNYYDLNEYKKAILYLESALRLKGSKSVDDSISVYSLLSECYMEKGDFDQAKSFALKSINIKASLFEVNTSLNAFASILINSNDSVNLGEAIKYSEEALRLSRSIQDQENVEVALNNLGRANKSLGKTKDALEYYNQAIDVIDKPDNYYNAILLNNIALVLIDQHKHTYSINILNESLTKYKLFYETYYNYDYAAPYENLADNYIALQQFQPAFFHYQKALINITNNFRTEDIFNNPNPADSSLFIYSNTDMIRVLHLKAIAAYQYYKQNDSLKYLNLANQCYQTAFNFHDQLQKDISTENSRLFQVKSIVFYGEHALKVANELQENGIDVSKAAFRFMEKNKATVLLQAMNEADALQFANLPDSLIEKEKDLKIAINHYNRQLNETVNPVDSTTIKQVDSLLFNTKLSYQKLINNLENNHPEYFRLKYQQNKIELADVQNQLDDQRALLSYFVGDTSIYTLLILKDRSQLFKIQKPADWEDIINNFQEAITLSDTDERFNKYNKKSFAKFVTNAHILYRCLLQGPLEELNNIPHLKIIPDAELNYIPFDLLLTNSVDTSSVNYIELPYLLKQKTISYAYSAALMMEQQQANTTEKDYAYVGYAPKYDNSNYSDLPQAHQLVKDMALFFKGKEYVDEETTKANFLKDTLSYQVLHLAMHGKLNDQYPLNSHLVFTKRENDTIEDQYKLYAADLYLRQLNTDFAILNACETGTGELRKGEGVMSLSRAFTYAGCPSLMMSLWSIDETSSVDILETFLKNIKKGSLKDVALQQAKLDYLNNTSAILSHPNYWAGLVLTGNTNAMQFKNSFSRFWWVLGVSVVLLVLFGGYLTFKKSSIM